MNKKNIILIITIILITLLISIGGSFAYFSANLTGGEDATTINVTGGLMRITYNGGSNINLSNIIPDDNPAAIKVFTITGNNTTEIEMHYQLNFIIEENTFSNNALQYQLISFNTDNNGEVVPSTPELINIGTNSQNIFLGIGNFNAPTNGEKAHTYHLEIYFPNQSYNQNIDQYKKIKAYIEITQAPQNKSLRTAILSQGGGTETIGSKQNPDFSIINDTTGLYAAVDNYGISYYYRGLKTQLNNNLIWGGFQWKIIRINGDSSVRLIYNGLESEFNINNEINNLGDTTDIGKHRWNILNTDDAKYVGYMYGGENGAPSNTREEAITNQTPANIKTVLDTWYEENILNKDFEIDVVDNLFCNDRLLDNEIGGNNPGPGYGKGIETYFAPRYRLYNNKIPDLKCNMQNDRFTVSDTSIGNAALTHQKN